jgi:esterase/lipase superfamily enzyme
MLLRNSGELYTLIVCELTIYAGFSHRPSRQPTTIKMRGQGSPIWGELMLLRRLWFFAVVLIGVVVASASCRAQDAADLIRLIARGIATDNLAILSDNSRLWLTQAGAPQVAQLRQLGAIEDVIGAKDQVIGTVWFAVGRAIHRDGASDWRLVYSGESKKIVRIELKVTMTPDVLPPLPNIALRGMPQPGGTVEVPAPDLSPAALSPCATFPELCASQERGEVDPRVVEFLFATTRTQIGAPNHVTFSGDRGSKMVLGAARVRVPESHSIGRIELPGSGLLDVLLSLSYETKADPRKHLVIQSVRTLSQAGWDEIIAAKNADEALVFVHGFNTDFDASVYRMAQIVWDLQYRGIPVLFSWASRGGVLNYAYDQNSALVARSSFIDLIKMLNAEHGIKRVHVLAHSMGNLLVLDALKDQPKISDPVRIAELMMAAPDVDRDYFVLNAPEIRKITTGMTLYASSVDKALVASREVAGGIPRAGDVPPQGPIVLPTMETIDVTAVGGETLGLNHDTFASSHPVLDDIGNLLTEDPRRLPNRRLIEIRGVPEGLVPPRYYRFAP